MYVKHLEPLFIKIDQMHIGGIKNFKAVLTQIGSLYVMQQSEPAATGCVTG